MSDSLTPALCLHWPERSDIKRGWLFRQSEVFRFAMDDVVHAPDPELLVYVSEQCVSSARLMQIAVAQFNIVAHGMHGSVLDCCTVPAWVFISSAHSAIDSIAAAIESIVCGELPKVGQNIPGANQFGKLLRKTNQRNNEIIAMMKQLCNSDWYKALDECRRKIMHRGFWPMNSWTLLGNGWHLVQSAHFLQVAEENASRVFPALSRGDSLNLMQIADGLLWKLEEWEASIAHILSASGFIETSWPGPVRQVIRLNDPDYLLPEACFMKD